MPDWHIPAHLMPDPRPLYARYLYMLKNAPGVFYVSGDPSLGDREAVKTDGLEIVRLSDFRYLGADGQWHPPKVGALSTIHGLPGPPLNLPVDAMKRSQHP